MEIYITLFHEERASADNEISRAMINKPVLSEQVFKKVWEVILRELVMMTFKCAVKMPNGET